MTAQHSLYVAVQPNGVPMRVVSGATVAACWNRLAASSNRSIGELKRAGWRVERDIAHAPGRTGTCAKPL